MVVKIKDIQERKKTGLRPQIFKIIRNRKVGFYNVTENDLNLSIPQLATA